MYHGVYNIVYKVKCRKIIPQRMGEKMEVCSGKFYINGITFFEVRV